MRSSWLQNNIDVVFPKDWRFRLLWSGMFISQFGSWFRIISTTVLIYEGKDSAFFVGLLWILGLLPPALLSPWIGRFIDDQGKIKVMFIASIGCASTGLLAAILIQHFWFIYTASMIIATLSFAFTVASQAFIPDIVKSRDQLVKANSMQTFSRYLSMCLGPVVAGVTVTWIGYFGSLLVDALSFLASAVCIAIITRNIDQPTPSPEGSDLPSSGFHIMEGITLISSNLVLSQIAWMDLISMLGFGAYSALLVVFAQEALGSGNIGYGMLFSADAVGAIVGSLSFIWPAILRKQRLLALVIGLSMIALATLILSQCSSLYAAVAVLVVEGVFLALYETVKTTIIQEQADAGTIGRVFSFFGLISNGAIILSILTLGALEPLLSVRGVFLVAGILASIAAVVGWWLLLISKDLLPPELLRVESK